MPFKTLTPASKSYWEKRRSVVLMDPAIATRNAGDEIISQAARHEVRMLLPAHFQTTIPTHERLGTRSYRLVQQARYTILAGSNILTTDLFLDRGWRYALQDTLFINDIISLAVGWRSYRRSKSFVGKMMLHRALSSSGIHSVRDEFSKQRLIEAGVPNVVNTACVTMWRLNVQRLRELPLQPSRRVVTTINGGNPHPNDKLIAEKLLQEYEEVFVWPQGIDDYLYVEELYGDRACIVPPTLCAYDELLESEGALDYVGTRLHGGIRALQRNRRALILAIDNRATEIARDTGLPTVARETSVDQICEQIRSPQLIDIKLPIEQIEEWRNQFQRTS